ncbi:MAG: diguanylate cyclase [Phycisphaerales bacterium]|nr:diguanylate cyclase [Phycisphaerales bacterium]MCB9863884.1 diguanylate cyclase [Phycisphaerales bacterium]
MTRSTESHSHDSPLILVINDEKQIANTIAAALRSVGYRTIIADTNESGLAIAERYSPNAILLDVNADEHDGFNLCRELKNRILTADTPVLFTTQNIDSDELIQRCFDVGANDLIAKPIRPTLLLARIRVALRESNLREEYKRLALTDQATGLDNRRQFFMHVTEAVTSSHRRQRDVYLMICDIDNLTAINTEHGYDLGDEIIIMLSRLTKRLISLDCRVGRIAGDAIGIVLKHADEPTADATAARILRTFEAIAFDAGTNPKHFTLSVGLARRIHETDHLTPDELMARADIALASAKSQGGRQIARYWHIADDRLSKLEPAARHARQTTRENTHRGSISIRKPNNESAPAPSDETR